MCHIKGSSELFEYSKKDLQGGHCEYHNQSNLLSLGQVKAVNERYRENKDHKITDDTRSSIGIPERCEVDAMAGRTLVPDTTDWLALKYSNNDTGQCIPYDECHDCEGRISK